MKRKAHRKLIIFLFAFIGFAVQGGLFTPAFSAPPVVKPMVSMNFDGVDIRTVVKYMSTLTKKNFIVNPKVQGKVTILSPRKVSIDEAYRIFESSLVTNGFTAVPQGRDVVKIIPVEEGRNAATLAFGSNRSAGMGEHYVTQLIQLRHKDSAKLVDLIRPLLSKVSQISAHEGTNTIIVTDFASKIRQVMKIVKDIDVQDERETYTYHLQNADAKKLGEKVQQIFKSMFAGAQGTAFSVEAMERTNSLVLVARGDDLPKMIHVIETLDKPAAVSRGNIHVYTLQNANALELAAVLSRITSNLDDQSKSTKGKEGEKLEFQGQVNVTADKSTNSLIITATAEDFETLKGVIEKLDRRQDQVFVEALIMEITSGRTKDFGIEWRTAPRNLEQNGINAIGGTSFGTASGIGINPITGPTFGTGLVVGLMDGVISYNGAKYLNLGGLLKAVQSDSDVNVLSTPNILTSNNEQAEIVVGQNIPIKVGSTVTAVGTTENIQRTDIGILLRIKPQISAGDFVRLSLYEEISDVTPAALAANSTNPITTKRSASTTVVVKDQQTVAIGGLVKDNITSSVSKIPVLGDIPVLGALFRQTNKTKNKINLVIFLTPHIIRTPEELQKVTAGKKLFMEKKEEEQKESNTWETVKDIFR